MASEIIKSKIQQPFLTVTEWESSNRILLYGEKVYAQVDSGAIRSKTGLGNKKFSELLYDDEDIYENLANKADNKLSNVSNGDFLSKATESGLGGGVGDILSSTQPIGQGENNTWLEIIS